MAGLLLEAGIAWWNCSLSPLGSERSTPEQTRFVVDTIHRLHSEINFSILGLGEVSEADVQKIIGMLPYGFLYLLPEKASGSRLKFDTAILYRPDVFDLIESETLEGVHGEKTFRVAQLCALQFRYGSHRIDFYAVHWSSRLQNPENSSFRDEYAIALRQRIKNRPKVYTVLFGDFNDEPFSGPVAQKLPSTRDKQLARSNEDFFYNPFWRFLGESDPTRLEGSGGGTYYFKRGFNTRWFTFDQMIFSSTMVQNTICRLVDESVSVWREKELVEAVIDGKSQFDHLPIYSAIEMEFIHD
ncbi:hypothetical protein GN316_16685 [Xylophilus sp. Kf1]|nr:hypothetical protein [Xylophilus sp. Kf1]